jgi:hypothetical protein
MKIHSPILTLFATASALFAQVGETNEANWKTNDPCEAL